MKATVKRFDVIYEVEYSRPAFNRISTFTQILEPIYDALSGELHIPSDAIRVESGNTIATAFVTISLFSGKWVFEARLDGYKAVFFDLQATNDLNLAKRYIDFFEDAVSRFLNNGNPANWRIGVPSWLKLEDSGVDVAVDLVNHLTWAQSNVDPFQIGSTKTESRVKFECLNKEQLWGVWVTLEKSALPDADLFYEVSATYYQGSQYDNLEKKSEHFENLFKVIAEKINLELE